MLTRGKRRRSGRGQSVVEFALLLPVLLLIVMVALDFGRIFLGWINLQQMVRVAADYAAANADAWGTPGDPVKQARYDELILNDARKINCETQDPLPDPIVTGTGLGSPVTSNIACTFGVITPIISHVLGGEILLNASVTYPVKQGLIGSIPGGGGPPVLAPVASFTASPTSGYGPLTVTFTDTSTNDPTSWLWDLDVALESQQGPHVVTYPACTEPDGVCEYGVRLTVQNSGGISTPAAATITVVELPPTGPVAEFEGDPLAGERPLDVDFAFVDVRNGAIDYTNWEWDFTADGTYDATGETTSHSYASAGSYGVTLRVTDATGATNVLTKNDFIVVGDRPCQVPDFANVLVSDAQALWDRAGFTTTVSAQPPTNPNKPNYKIRYQSLPGGVVNPPGGCDAAIEVGPDRR